MLFVIRRRSSAPGVPTPNEHRPLHKSQHGRDLVRPGIREIVARSPVPVVPLALRGLWGSFFSRAWRGRAMRRLRGAFSRIELVAGAPLAPQDATPERLHDAVLALRGANDGR